MLGKRSHQIQRSTSMSQLRAPPGSRTRAGATSPIGAHVKKDSASQQDNNPSSTYMKGGGGIHNLQPSTLDGAQQAEMQIGSPHNMVNVEGSTVEYAHSHGHLKPLDLPLKVGFSPPPLPVHSKPTRVESFLDACFSCKRPLGHGKDIFMYRGDTAFCTEECRLRQMSCDETCSASASQSTASDSTIDNPKGARISAPTGAF